MDGSIRQLTFQVQHDCPLAACSRDVDVPLQSWSGHRFEVVAMRGKPAQWQRFRDAAAQHLDPVRTVPTAEGGFVVWHPGADPTRSISRIIERHDMMWQQPVRAEDGWEHYDAISFGANEQAALDELRALCPTRVVRRRSIRPEDVTAALFMSLQPAMDAPTDKQAQALLAAWQQGYYQTPRGATTADIAKSMGLGRSAFEERLRGAENRLVDAIAPALALRRQD